MATRCLCKPVITGPLRLERTRNGPVRACFDGPVTGPLLSSYNGPVTGSEPVTGTSIFTCVNCRMAIFLNSSFLNISVSNIFGFKTRNGPVILTGP